MAARAGTDRSGQMIAICFYRREKMTGNTQRAAGRIVVGVDGTAASLTAVRWAAQEALLRRASVHLVFVSRHYEHASYSGSPGVSPPGEDHAYGRALLAAAELEAGRALPPGRLSAELADGSPAKVLIDRSADAELLVLGTAYPAGQPADEVPPIVGSTVRACLHGAACPVVIAATRAELERQRVQGTSPAPGQAIRQPGSLPARTHVYAALVTRDWSQHAVPCPTGRA